MVSKASIIVVFESLNMKLIFIMFSAYSLSGIHKELSLFISSLAFKLPFKINVESIALI